MANYYVSDRAQQDLIEIWNYSFETWSVDQANEYYDFLIEQFEIISINPFIGRSYDEIRKGYRGLISNQHTIFYIIHSNGLIEIIRILNQNEDVMRKL